MSEISRQVSAELRAPRLRAGASSAPPPPELAWHFATADGRPQAPSSFARAKREAREIYAEQRTTFYCGCPFGADQRVRWQSCGFQPRANARRAGRVEWEHVVPAHAFGGHRACWSQDSCGSGNGRRTRGRACCRKIDPVFRRMEADLQNLVPAIGEVNGDRSNFRFGDVDGEPRAYGRCDFEIDWHRRVAEPDDRVRGDIARAYLYMYHAYPGALPLTEEERAVFWRWHRDDPPSPWERTRDRRIAAVQGGGNPLVNTGLTQRGEAGAAAASE